MFWERHTEESRTVTTLHGLQPCTTLGGSNCQFVVMTVPCMLSINSMRMQLSFSPNYETYLSCCMTSLPDWRLPVVGSMVNVSSGSSLGSSMKMPESLQFMCNPTSGNPLQWVSFVLSRFGPGQQGVAALPTVANPTNIHCITAKKH